MGKSGVILPAGRFKAFGEEDSELVHGLLPVLGRPPGPRHSDGMMFLASFVKRKIVNFHKLMTGACKPLWNQVYSRLLGDRNECSERSLPDVLLEGSRRPTQTQQWDAA